MKKQYIIVEHRTSAALNNLRDQLRDLQVSYDKLKKDFRQLEVRYGEEVHLNSELVDILKAHKISFREALAHSFRHKA